MFIGRKSEIKILSELKSKASKARLAIVYGRRRVGKTTLIEHVFKSSKLIKIEGIEGQGEDAQIKNFIDTLTKYFSSPILRTSKPENWKQTFEILASLVKNGQYLIYLEELQWMANYSDKLISELKPVWDNEFQHNPDLILILCGSSPSFFINKVIRSKALYNRSNLELNLEEFPIHEASKFLEKKSLRSIFDAYLTVGGIPVYLERLNSESSVYLSLCSNSFTKNSFFLEEYEKVFVSSFGKNQTYRNLVEVISMKQKCTRNDLLKILKLETGGTLTNILLDLESCNFIKQITPFNKNEKTLLSYYQISDSYLNFYYNFIKPNIVEIKNGNFQKKPERLLDLRNYSQWLGYSFERFCRNNAERIAEILGFSAVNYRAGTFFRRTNLNNYGTQIDLLFDRKDRVKTVCEIKYKDAPIGLEVIESIERKINTLNLKPKESLQRVLITASGITNTLRERQYFDAVIELEDLYD